MLIGMALGIMAAVVWASYGIAQKVLLRTISPGRHADEHGPDAALHPFGLP